MPSLLSFASRHSTCRRRSPPPALSEGDARMKDNGAEELKECHRLLLLLLHCRLPSPSSPLASSLPLPLSPPLLPIVRVTPSPSRSKTPATNCSQSKLFVGGTECYVQRYTPSNALPPSSSPFRPCHSSTRPSCRFLTCEPVCRCVAIEVDAYQPHLLIPTAPSATSASRRTAALSRTPLESH